MFQPCQTVLMLAPEMRGEMMSTQAHKLVTLRLWLSGDEEPVVSIVKEQWRRLTKPRVTEACPAVWKQNTGCEKRPSDSLKTTETTSSPHTGSVLQFRISSDQQTVTLWRGGKQGQLEFEVTHTHQTHRYTYNGEHWQTSTCLFLSVVFSLYEYQI